MEGLSDKCKKHLVNSVLNTRDKVHLMTLINTDAKTFSHFSTYRRLKGTEATLTEWAVLWFKKLDHKPNTLGYCVDWWSFAFTSSCSWALSVYEGIEEVLTKYYVRIDINKRECYMKTIAIEQEIQLNIEVPVEIKPENTVPIINSVDDYFNIVAPHCEAILELLLKIHNNKRT
jgi:hypothetical protein